MMIPLFLQENQSLCVFLGFKSLLESSLLVSRVSIISIIIIIFASPKQNHGHTQESLDLLDCLVYFVDPCLWPTIECQQQQPTSNHFYVRSSSANSLWSLFRSRRVYDDDRTQTFHHTSSSEKHWKLFPQDARKVRQNWCLFESSNLNDDPSLGSTGNASSARKGTLNSPTRSEKDERDIYIIEETFVVMSFPCEEYLFVASISPLIVVIVLVVLASGVH